MTGDVEPRLLEDPLIHRIPGDWPQAFLRLPYSEQRWRGRVVLIAYILGGSLPFAWSMALNADPTVSADNRAAAAEVSDATIAEGLDHLRTRSG